MTYTQKRKSGEVHFQTKRDFYLGTKTFQWATNIGAGGALAPSVMLKKALKQSFNINHKECN